MRHVLVSHSKWKQSALISSSCSVTEAQDVTSRFDQSFSLCFSDETVFFFSLLIVSCSSWLRCSRSTKLTVKDLLSSSNTASFCVHVCTVCGSTRPHPEVITTSKVKPGRNQCLWNAACRDVCGLCSWRADLYWTTTSLLSTHSSVNMVHVNETFGAETNSTETYFQRIFGRRTVVSRYIGCLFVHLLFSLGSKWSGDGSLCVSYKWNQDFV